MRCCPASIRLLLTSVTALVVAGGAVPLQAQSTRGAFETMTIHVGGATNFNRTAFHRFWQPGQGGDVTIQTPFYAGQVETGLALHQYAAATDDVPAFDAMQMHVGWSLPVTLSPRLQWQTGFRLGNYYMRFGDAVQNGHVGCDLGGIKRCGDDAATIGGDSESEFFMGLHTRLQVRMAPTWSVHTGAYLMNAYTHERIRLVYFSAGISYTVQTPDWLQVFLR